MIVNSLENGWEVIYQRSHANLAAILLAAWQKQDHVNRWTELIIAAAQHDDQEMFWSESKHLTDQGTPMDFTMGDVDTSHTQATHVIENAYRQGLWIALMISMHNSYLYEPLRGQSEQLDAFLDQQRTNQNEWRSCLDYTSTEANEAYSFIRWADQLSLLLCQNALADHERELDIAPDMRGNMIRVVQRKDRTLGLTPWILEDDELHVSVEVRCLKQVQFDSEGRFLRAMDEAEVQVRKWKFRK